MASKYDSFATFMRNNHGDDKVVKFTFSEIETILGFDLPPSARIYQSWWQNTRNTVHVFSRVYLREGWVVKKINLHDETVEFWKVADPIIKDEYQLHKSFNNSEQDILENSGESTNISFRSSASFGKRQEYIAVAELLKRGMDVYMTLVDDQGIDCIIRRETVDHLVYLDIQIKARSSDCASKNAGFFPLLFIPKPRDNYFFIFYADAVKTYWVIPSKDIIRLARQNKSGKNKGAYSIRLCNPIRSGFTKVSKYSKYENAFSLLNKMG